MDLAIWRRIKLLPFTETIPEAERDDRLGETLAAEADTVLAWAVAGYSRFREEGLTPVPERVAAATDSYREEQDPILDSIEERCEPGAGI